MPPLFWSKLSVSGIFQKGETKVRSKWKYAVTGSLAGLCNGLFGSGGGLFLVPLLTQWTGLDQRKGFATSVAVILPLSLFSAGVYFLQGGIDLRGPGPICWEALWEACSPVKFSAGCPWSGCAGPLGC